MPVLQSLQQFLEKGFINFKEEKQKEKEQEQLDGTGLGDAAGEENIDDQVKNEDLSDD